MASGKTQLVAQDQRADIGDALYDPKTGRAQAYSVNYLKSEYVPLDPSMTADLAFLKEAAKGQFAITSRTDADDKWLVTVDRVTTPQTTWLYERKGQRLTPLFAARPELEGAPLVQMFPQEIKARGWARRADWRHAEGVNGAGETRGRVRGRLEGRDRSEVGECRAGRPGLSG